MANSIVASYQAHQAAVALHNADDQPNGGESAEWPEIADTLARIYLACLGEEGLALERPLRNAWAYPVRRPNGDWPNLVVIHDHSAPTDHVNNWRKWTHYAQIVLICGPWGNDPGAMQALGTPYMDPLVRTIDENQSLERRVRAVKVGAGGPRWHVLSYGDPPRNQWYGLTLPLEIEAYNLRVWRG